MARPAHPMHHTLTDYIRLEEHANTKHEYLDGQIYAMAGGTPEHAALCVGVSSSLFAQLQGKPCRVYSSDLRIGIAATGLVTYPDISVVCGPLQRHPNDKNTVVNPVLVVEITSPSTEEYDRGDKLEHFKAIPSLREMVIVSHRERLIECWKREAGAWTHGVSRDGERATLESIQCAIDVAAVYAAALES